MKYQIAKGSNPNESVLVINGVNSVCPFCPPFPIPDGENIKLVRVPCTTQCPHAELAGHKFTISCGSERRSINVEIIPESKNTLHSI